jgi:phage-related minor tail protein
MVAQATDLNPCKKCGGIERYKNHHCVACSKEYGRQYRQANAEKIREQERQYRKANPEKIRERQHQWRQANTEKIREYERLYRQINSEKIKERQHRYRQINSEKIKESERQYRQTNPEKVKEINRRWQQINTEKIREYKCRRRARKAKVESQPYDFKAICNYYGNSCLCCGRGDLPLTPDHIIPFSWGGPDIADNIQPLCGPCNSAKGDRHATDYRPDQGPELPQQLSFEDAMTYHSNHCTKTAAAIAADD